MLWGKGRGIRGETNGPPDADSQNVLLSLLSLVAVAVPVYSDLWKVRA